MTIGFNDLFDLKPHDLFDFSEFQKIRLKSGMTFDQYAALVQRGLDVLNAELAKAKPFGDLVAYQTEVFVEYPTGAGQGGFKPLSEYATPDPVSGATTGHSLPIETYATAVGWTMRALRYAPMSKLQATATNVMKDARDNWQHTILTRLFSNEAERVGQTNGASVPLADGGVSDPNYIPPKSPSGKTFDATHNHYLRQDAITDVNVLAALQHLTEHGHTMPVDILVSEADLLTWQALTGKVTWKAPALPELVNPTERARLPEGYAGMLETPYGWMRVISSPRLPTGYYAIYKTYGLGDQRNPLRVRLNPDFGYGYHLVDGSWVNAPTHLAAFSAEFGVGIGGDRTNGVCVKIAATGDYTAPTIS